ncbi:hypothetical protein OAM69_04680 [bacterium]|nr:hypothetical protein [bacterium]
MTLRIYLLFLLTGDEAWSWCGDAMDYDLALFATASHVRHGLQDDRQSG